MIFVCDGPCHPEPHVHAPEAAVRLVHRQVFCENLVSQVDLAPLVDEWRRSIRPLSLLELARWRSAQLVP